MSRHTTSFFDNRWGAWVAVAAGVFMATLDSSIVNISLPKIAVSLNSDLPSTEWLVLSYMVGLTALLIPVGRLSDGLGRRPIYVIGLLLFTLGSFLCGISHSVEMLIGMRLLQAVGAAGIMANGPAIVTELFETNRGKAIGMIGTVVSLGTMVGPSLGGWLVEAWGWPWIFWVNVPVGVVVAFYAWQSLRSLHPPRKNQPSFDAPSAVWSGLSLASLSLIGTYGITLGLTHPLNFVLLTVTAISLFTFIRRGLSIPHPLIPFHIFRDKTLTNACVASFLSFIGINLVFFLCPFYLQQTLNLSPSRAGWFLITTALALSLMSPLSGSLYDRLKNRHLATLGMLISAGALFGISQFNAETPLWLVVVCFMGVGCGNGLFQPPNNVQLMGSVPEKVLGLVGGLMAIVRTMGMMFGITLAGFVFQLNQVPLTPSPGFVPTFQIVFQLGALFTLLNAIWLEVYRDKTPLAI